MPGHRCYGNATLYGRNVIMFGENHLWHINRKRFSDSLPKCRTFLKYFSGGRTKDLEYYVTLTLDEEKTDIVVVHINFSDIDFPQLRHNNVENIEKDVLILVKNVGRAGFLKY